METIWAPWRHAYITGAAEPARKGVPAALAAWPGPDSGCVFCNMLGAVQWAIREGMGPEEAEHAAGIVYQGPEIFVCLNAFPYNSGHVLVLPYAHLSRLVDLPVSAATEMMLICRQIESALRQVYRPEGLNFGMNIGSAAGAGVADHLHMHALPRWAGDTNFMTALAETRVLPESLDVTWSRLRGSLSPEATSLAGERS